MIEAKLTVLERNRVVDAFLLGAVPVGLAAFALFVAFRFLPGVFGVHVAVLAALVRYLRVRQNSSPVRRERTVRVSDAGVQVEGQPMVPRARITSGYYQPRSIGSSVRLFDRYRRVVFEAEVATEEEGMALLHALGLDATQQRVDFHGSSPLTATLARSAAFFFAAFALVSTVHHYFSPVGFDGVFLVPILVALGVVPSKIVVGVDGVLHRWLLHRRFLPLSEIASVHEEGANAIRFTKKDGTEELLYTSGHKRVDDLYVQHRNAVLARIREALQHHLEHGPAPDVAALVGRSGRTPADWKRSLASLASREGTYRQTAIRDDDLLRIVEDPRAPEDARAAAAVVLRARLDDEAKARVRIAAEATASPKLRIALDAATGDSDERATDALDELAVEAPAAAKRAPPS